MAALAFDDAFAAVGADAEAYWASLEAFFRLLSILFRDGSSERVFDVNSEFRKPSIGPE
ncbi:MAG: hypothetical protein KGS61_04710 [Verrucomicrobia bacterium]|nr:hypothetical protein [Verrucomicrobiota bacterium]